MDAPSTPASDTARTTLIETATYGYFLCTGFLLADAWFPRAVLVEIARRTGVADVEVGTAAVQRLLATGWLRGSPNGKWLKLAVDNDLRLSWEQQSEGNRSSARQIVQQVLLQLAHELRQSDDHETLALVLRQLVHLVRLAVDARDAAAAGMLLELGAGFERLGMDAEARTAYRDAAALLDPQGVTGKAH